ncbi:MAG: bis(5'-nucleosyl)-tetraphosphatase [Nitrososphaerota archaeon]
MIRERSAGAVIFYTNGEPVYLLLHYPAGHWDFPKGNVEKGESDLDTVRREVREETGIEAIDILRGFKKEIEYYYRREDGLVRKRVVFYLAKSETKDVRVSPEHLGYVWLPYEKALKIVTFKNSKEVLMEAHKFVQNDFKRATQLDEYFRLSHEG